MSEPRWCVCEGVRCGVCEDEIASLRRDLDAARSEATANGIVRDAWKARAIEDEARLAEALARLDRASGRKP